MAANFNVITFTKSIINLSWLLKVLQERGYDANINQIESIGNWEFNDLINHPHDVEIAEVLALLEKGRIILIFGEVQSNKFVMMLSKTGTIYETGVSLDTKYIDYLDSDTLNDVTRPIYDEISNVLLSSEMVNNLLVSALGVEVVVDYDEDFHKMHLDSHNVVRWVFGTEEGLGEHNLMGYTRVAAGIWDREN
ncbi:hypothetical protein [Paenibacillus borealis]|uniref:Uncharacterized protein n=1 Tax=Paenibacillus borealis TaxID=160799 RepID=A0A089L9B5_PAEBO|nr:hypothetical protein [Paenibacillus borealis]AIQ58071.1 hypothetical protein PBOR_14895 [Paenibacillus borealis]